MRFIQTIAFGASLSAACLIAASPAALDGNPTVQAKKNANPEAFIREEAHRHWAFQPVVHIEPPQVRTTQWARTPVDLFILARLEANGLSPASPASRAELIRRVTFDLIGLPPALGEMESFVQDSSPEAYARLIDRLLASPHYGERWGQHWLDLARFAETDGFEHDAVRPHAWRYRDYVIQSFNRDKPYDRFIREQLAGDQANEPEALIATAFNLLGPDMVDSADQVQRRHNRLNDMTDTAALAFLGLTMGCARCHDHKFEPLSQTDYYGLQAFFSPAHFRDDLPVPTKSERAAHEAELSKYDTLTHDQRQAVAALEAPLRERTYQAKLAKLSPEAQLAFNTPPAQRTAEQSNQIQETSALLEVSEKEILNVMSPDDRSRHGALKESLALFPKPPPLPMTLALQNPTQATNTTRILLRGDYNRPGEVVKPGFPEVLRGRTSSKEASSSARLRAGLSPTAAASPPESPEEAGLHPPEGRMALADWVASPSNPLTVRVMVNRLWQHHFGRGLVPTPSDFGTHGGRPSHPELLDWLAGELTARGWSLKEMHRLLLLSAVYQQSSRATPETLARDPENQLHSRRNRIRLEGEVIRDSLLAISGALNRRMAGPGVFPSLPEDVFKGASGWSVSKRLEDQQRRSIYVFARRNLRFPFLEVFDAPDSNLSCPERLRSTSAPQSLTLLNAAEVMAASEVTAARLIREASSGEGRLDLAYRLILGRPPGEKEKFLAQAFLEHAPWSELCRALFNLNAFVYVE